MYLSWRFFQKCIFPVFILASGAVRTTPSSCRHTFMRSLIWRWWAFAKIRQIKNHAKLTSLYSIMAEKVTKNKIPKGFPALCSSLAWHIGKELGCFHVLKRSFTSKGCIVIHAFDIVHNDGTSSRKFSFSFDIKISVIFCLHVASSCYKQHYSLQRGTPVREG